MLCLHGEPALPVSKINGTFWICRHRNWDSNCHFSCEEKELAPLYDKAVKAFLATKKDRPQCCAITSTMTRDGVTEPPVVTGHCYAVMKVITDKENENYGRPFFVCPLRHEPCNYFAWGDE